jgi:hypothetical protein
MASSHPRQPNILQVVRASFIMQGSSLGRWCRENDVEPGWAWRVLQGKHDGPAANTLRDRLVSASMRAAA